MSVDESSSCPCPQDNSSCLMVDVNVTGVPDPDPDVSSSSCTDPEPDPDVSSSSPPPNPPSSLPQRIQKIRIKRIPQKDKEVLALKVTGIVKWFSVKAGYGFINRNDTSEDVFVHQTAIVRQNPKQVLRSLGDGEEVEFDVVIGDKGREVANLTGLNGEAVRGSPYAADRRRYRGYNRAGGRGNDIRKGKSDDKGENKENDPTKDMKEGGGDNGGVVKDKATTTRRRRRRNNRGGRGRGGGLGGGEPKPNSSPRSDSSPQSQGTDGEVVKDKVEEKKVGGQRRGNGRGSRRLRPRRGGPRLQTQTSPQSQRSEGEVVKDKVDEKKVEVEVEVEEEDVRRRRGSSSRLDSSHQIEVMKQETDVKLD